MAQLGAQRVRTAKVAGSTPAESTCGVQSNWLALGTNKRKEVIDVAVLLLNVNGAPARVIDERRAWSLLERGKAAIVLEPPTPLRSAGGVRRRPSVMYLTCFARLGPVGWSRREVLVRDGFLCAYCGTPAATIDHVLPQW